MGNVLFSLDDLEKFINYASKELSVELGDDDYEGLLKVMRVLNEVRAKVDAGTEQMFDPLRDIIDVLKEYGVDFPEETYEQVRFLKALVESNLKLVIILSKKNIFINFYILIYATGLQSTELHIYSVHTLVRVLMVVAYKYSFCGYYKTFIF